MINSDERNQEENKKNELGQNRTKPKSGNTTGQTTGKIMACLRCGNGSPTKINKTTQMQSHQSRLL